MRAIGRPPNCIPEHINDFQRLVKDLRFGSRFPLLVAEFNEVPYREALIERIDAVLADVGLRSARIRLSVEDYPDLATLENELESFAMSHEAIHLTGGESWFDEPRWQALNIRREAFARRAPVRLILWLTAAPIAHLSPLAPDLWAWRGGVFSFASAVVLPRQVPEPQAGPIDARSLATRSKRIAEIRAYLRADPPPPQDLRLGLLDEMAGLLRSIGELDEALRIRREEELPVYERLGDMRSWAITLGKIAGVLQARGELDKALRIYREEALPALERLGDVWARAATLGKTADVMEARGELDEALRIRREEELPVYQHLGDIRSRAMTLGKIADVLHWRGELAEALRIYRVEALPAFERLGDVRGRAVTLGKIADVLQAHGELDEALRIRREEELPVYERLGDVRGRAVTLGKIADVLQVRGELDEALRIRREEELPVYERIGDMRERAVALFKLGIALAAKGERGDAHTVLARALADAQRLKMPQAEQIRELIKIMEKSGAFGDWRR